MTVLLVTKLGKGHWELQGVPDPPGDQRWVYCPYCDGSGTWGGKKCPRCGGGGRLILKAQQPSPAGSGGEVGDGR
jgi:DnaJ-class molecular chaperone